MKMFLSFCSSRKKRISDEMKITLLISVLFSPTKDHVEIDPYVRSIEKVKGDLVKN